MYIYIYISVPWIRNVLSCFLLAMEVKDHVENRPPEIYRSLTRVPPIRGSKGQGLNHLENHKPLELLMK